MDIDIIPRPKKMQEVDYLRGLGILGVIAIHTTGYFTLIKKASPLQILNLGIDVFAHYAVPLFIFISGFILFYRYHNDFSVFEFYKKRIRSIIPQYFVFTIFYTLLNNGIDQLSQADKFITILVRNILFAKAEYHLWYFSIIIQFYLLYPLLLKLYHKFKFKNRIHYYILSSAVLQIIWNEVFEGYHLLGIIQIHVFFSHLWFFLLGMYVKDHYSSIKTGIKAQHYSILLTTNLLLIIVSSFPTVSGLLRGFQYNEIPFYYNIGSIAIDPLLRAAALLLLFKVCLGLFKRELFAKMLAELGRLSFGIYLIHLFFLKQIVSYLLRFHYSYSNAAFYIILFCGTLILSYLAVKGLSIIPGSYYLVGTSKK